MQIQSMQTISNSTVPSETIRPLTWSYTYNFQCFIHRVHRVATAAFWRTFSVKLALAGEGGGCTPTPSYYIYLHQ
jgi:hypothetical protein